MPYDIAIRQDDGFTQVTFHGTTTGRDIIAATDELLARPDYDAGLDQLWDLNDVTKLLVGPEEMGELVERDRAHVASGAMGEVHVAIVVAGELRKLVIHLYEYQMRASGQHIRLFDEAAEAEAWLRGQRADRRAS
jgi:hypothetical protein